MMIGYRMQEATPEDVMADDPFGGQGVFLPLVATAEDILDIMERTFGEVLPAVAWPMRGAWVNVAATRMTPPELLARWENRGAW